MIQLAGESAADFERWEIVARETEMVEMYSVGKPAAVENRADAKRSARRSWRLSTIRANRYEARDRAGKFCRPAGSTLLADI